MPAPHAVPAATPEQFVQSLIAHLFADVVARRAARHERVLAIMPSNVLARGAARLPSSDQPWAAWDHDLALVAERDAAIAATLRTDAQRAAFAANAAAHRQMVYGLRRDVEGHRDHGDPGPARQA